MRSTPIKRHGLGFRLAAMLMLPITLVAGFVFPPFWIGTLVCLMAMFTTAKHSRCPICDERVEVRKKRGGMLCRGCRSRLVVRNKRLHAV